VLLALDAFCPPTVSAGLIDSWRAADLESAFTNGQRVDHWVSQLGRDLTAETSDLQPTLVRNATPAGTSAVRFDQNRLKTVSSPAGGLSSFSLAIVFRADAAGSSGSQWYQNAGMVDAEQGGVTSDWGLAIDSSGRLGWGCGNPDQTLYSDVGSLVDAQYHAAVFAWGGGSKSIYLDNGWSGSVSGVTTGTRNNAGLAFGRLLTDVNSFFVGDIVEVRFYDTALDEAEATNVIQDLHETYLTAGPAITSFTANTNEIFIDTPLTLSWNVTNALSVKILPAPGDVAASGTTQVFPRTNTTYTLIATNLLGVRSRELFIAVDQGIPVASNQAVSTLRSQPVAVTLTGFDPQGSNLTYNVVANPAHGDLSSSGAIRTYTPDASFIGNDQFTFRANDGEFDSPPATVSIQVNDGPVAPSTVTISTTNINVGTVPGSFVATLGAIDFNLQDAHTFSLVNGYEDNARFTISGNQLRAGDTFVGNLGATFAIRVRATDSAGLWREENFVLTVAAYSQSVVINEVHYNPSENTVLEEFVELHNPTAVPVDISGWEISGAVDFTFGNVVIPPGGFVIAAQDPATIQARFGQTAFGPWSGGLSSDGEEIELKNANGDTVDTVDYRAEFPWPIAADGEGASMALVNPSLDNDLGSSWRSEFPPTPGATNAAFSLNAAPNIRQVQHFPQTPKSSDPIRITAKVTDPEGVGSVQLQYQLVSPGNYIPAVLPVPVSQLVANPDLEPTPNPAYTNAANWTTLTMSDNGANGDATANDGVYTTVLPAQGNRVLVRYRIVITDALGATRRAPFEDDPSLNFACFVYDGIPDYQGISANALRSLPVYTLIARNQDVTDCTAYSSAAQLPQFTVGNLAHMSRFAFNWPGTLVYDGEVYDNIRYRLRGANGRYQPGKRSWRFKMNDGRAFQARDQFGNKLSRKWTHITAGKGSNNRFALTFSLNESVNYFLWNKVGVPAPNTVFFHYRVITTPTEAPSQYTGDFWGLNWAQEDYDADFLDTHNLEKGNLYKLINASFSYNLAQDMVGQRRYQAPFAVSDGTDGATIQNGLLTSQTTEWIRAHVNVNEWYRYHAVCEAIRHYDFWPDANKNAAWYFAPPYNSSNDYFGQFWFLPWDTDCTWGSTWNNGVDLVYNGIFQGGGHPELVLEYRNTVRELRDLLFQSDQINPVIDAYAARIRAFVPADLARWSNPPGNVGSYARLTSAGGFISPGLNDGVDGVAQDMKNFMFVGGSHPWWVDRQSVSTGGWIKRLDQVQTDTSIPDQPTIYYTGQPGYPMNSLTFECLPFDDPQGSGTLAGMQWRLAEIQDTNLPSADPRIVPPLEWDAIWESGTLTVWSNRITIPAQYVQTGKLYRARVRHLDDTGRWSHWSEPVEFSVTSADTVSVLRQNLRFSEIMYHPPDASGFTGDDLEFLELQNIGATDLDLSGLTFTAGITFTFPNNTTLAAGSFFLLARNAAAIAAVYPGVTVNGIYSGKLDNGGETLRLSTPTSATVLEMTYEDTSPWPVTTDGMGWSLVLDDAVAGTYRASSEINGSPGVADPANSIPPIVINELLTHTDPPLIDTIELFNPTDAAVDLSGWFLSDKADIPKKFRIPNGTIIAAKGFVTFDQSEFDDFGLDFNLNSLGDEAYLFSADANGNLSGYVHAATFGASQNGVSFGRYVNSQGAEDFVAMSSRTLGFSNSTPRVGPIVISEIMFQPSPIGTNENYAGEFIELQNIAATNVPLYDVAFPTNTWHLDNGVTFAFPVGSSLAAGERLLIVSFDPNDAVAANAFRSLYNVETDVPLFGPWSGRLSNDGESIELKFADDPEVDGFVPYIMAEKVSYRPTGPWPVSAAGTGLSLQRSAVLSFGNEPLNWFIAEPTPGTLASQQIAFDSDGDGLPDLWETDFGFDPFIANADGEDSDHDGSSDFAEWRAGTDPRNAGSVLTLEANLSGSSVVRLQFTAMADRAYRIEFTESLANPLWLTVTEVPSEPTNRTITVDQSAQAARFYRIVIP